MTSCAGPGSGRCWVWRLMRSWVSGGPGVVALLCGVDRQQFIRAGLGAGAVVGSAGFLDLLPGPATHVPLVVGTTHVAEVRAAAEAFKGWDARYGGGLMREAAVAQLRYCAGLLGARCPEAVKNELLTAVGSFAETAGFMAYDDYAHDDAERMYRFALACAPAGPSTTCATCAASPNPTPTSPRSPTCATASAPPSPCDSARTRVLTRRSAGSARGALVRNAPRIGCVADGSWRGIRCVGAA